MVCLQVRGPFLLERSVQILIRSTGCSDPKPQHVFTSISVGLTSRISAKLKGEIWANEYVDFRSLLISSLRSEGKYYLSMTPSAGSSNQPQLTLKPCHPTKPIQNIQQRVSAYNIFGLVYTERFKEETTKSKKYFEVVRDFIGFGMMSGFDTSGSLTLKSSSGVKFTGNCGCERPLIFVDRFRPPPSRKNLSALVSPSSLKILAGHFRPESTALGASSSACVTNAVPNIWEATVRFRQLKPVSAVSEVSERERRLKPISGSPQPTSHTDKGESAWNFSTTRA